MTVFLDAHSTTPVDSRVVKAMEPYYELCYGNASSAHAMGIAAREAVEVVRARVARLINATPEQVFFTSGASESNNTVIRGLYSKVRQTDMGELSIITSPLEHASILETVRFLVASDHHLHEHLVEVNDKGTLVGFGQALEVFSPLLCSIQAANHEIGTINHLSVIGECCLERGIFFHTDATQAIGKTGINVQEQHIDALSFSAHKIGGPKGVGVLYLKDPSRIDPLICGGLQEQIRSGTLNVPGIVGLGEAIKLLHEFDVDNTIRQRDLLFYLISNSLPDIVVNGSFDDRLPNNLNISIPGVPSEVFVKGLKDVIVSAGSACKSGKDKPSDILLAIKAKHPDCALRFGLWHNSDEDIHYAAERIISVAKEVRGESDFEIDIPNLL
jgi:cysteine desulfurase